ncbi:hypothetical protein LguiA_015505 [Lonicera macranthoides]
MATGWVKSLKCKSRALDDVVNRHQMKQKYHPLVSTSSSCRKSVQSLKDVVVDNTTKPKKHKRNKSEPTSRKPDSDHNSAHPITTPLSRASTRLSRAPDPLLPALAELPEGHPSRNVVEIIFHTSWSPKAFSGQVDMVFKVQNLGRTVTRFEEYRETVRSHASTYGGGFEDHARCVADGNEVMGFHCLGPTGGGAYDAGGALNIRAGKGSAICTFSGSGAAHENAGGGRGRRAMLVCRVVAGRVCKRVGFESLLEGRVGFDSVSGENGEMLVFDPRAVLPCFLIIYKL